MALADFLQRRITCKQEKRTFEKASDVAAAIREAAKENTANADATSVKIPLCISLDMFIAFREEFAGGWNVWSGDNDVPALTTEQKEELSLMTFDEKASMFFRLSVWSKKTPDPNAQAITDIPDGAEVFIDRVTGLSLFEDKLAQGNATRVELVIKVDEPDSEVESRAPASGSQTTEGNQTDHEHPLATTRSKRNKTCRGKSGDAEGQLLTTKHESSPKPSGVPDQGEDRLRPKKTGASKKPRAE